MIIFTGFKHISIDQYMPLDNKNIFLDKIMRAMEIRGHTIVYYLIQQYSSSGIAQLSHGWCNTRIHLCLKQHLKGFVEVQP